MYRLSASAVRELSSSSSSAASTLSALSASTLRGVLMEVAGMGLDRPIPATGIVAMGENANVVPAGPPDRARAYVAAWGV